MQKKRNHSLILALLFFCNTLIHIPIMAQSNEVLSPISNADIVSFQVIEQLKVSEIISNKQNPFRVVAQFPDRNMTSIYDALLGFGKTIKQTNDIDYIELRLFPNNSLTQINPEEARRSLLGELHILSYSSDSVLKSTEIMKYNFFDVILLSDLEHVESSWNGARFHQKVLLNERNLWRQIGQPSLIAVATGVTVFLLFNVRGS